ncbi:MAG: aspartate kinase [Bdellovibrionota bacterium]
MPLHVLKFGGTSVGSLKRIENVAEILIERSKKADVVAVVSAMSGETDHLLQNAQYFSQSPSREELDVLLCTGEQKSVALLSICLQSRGAKSQSFLGSQIKIKTDSDHNRARIQSIDDQKIRQALNEKKIVVIPGFQGVSPEERLTTLGRGGSDTSAVAIAAALKADLCEIYTDVEGVFTTDPNVEPNARKLSKITFDEMLELASLGAKVLQTRSVEFAKKYKIPIHVRSTFKNVIGTWVVEAMDSMESLVVSGITYTKNEAKVVVEGLPNRLGLAADLFELLGREGILVDVIVQNVSTEGRSDISFTVPRDELTRALGILEKNQKDLGHRRASGDPHISKVSIIGNGMRSHSGVAAQAFRALAQEGVDIQMISTSEIKISCVVDEAKSKQAVRALHASFGLDKIPVSEVNDFL